MNSALPCERWNTIPYANRCIIAVSGGCFSDDFPTKYFTKSSTNAPSSFACSMRSKIIKGKFHDHDPLFSKSPGLLKNAL